MPLNKLDSIIKNTEGRILYVSPSDLDSTDSIDNTGNSLARPFKTLQRAVIESARFSYVKGNSNDLTERTTILLMPGEHVIDNRPGYTIDSAGTVSTSDGSAVRSLPLTLDSVFDLTQKDNDLYKFNSVNGGVIIPRGTSIVGLDLRKTKLRPLYVPNPTDDNVDYSALFRITGACYLWQFSIFDGDEFGTVYTQPNNFDDKASPTFSHHKLTVFEYADGVNEVSNTGLTDLQMYYAKLSNAYRQGSGRAIDGDDVFPVNSLGFSPVRPEFEIVGAFAADPIVISSIQAGDGSDATRRITVTTQQPHGLNVGTPIRIKGVTGDTEYNISTKVTDIDNDNDNIFFYSITADPTFVNPGPFTNQGTVTIETDTVSGASPYIFNISMRSVWGMQGMHADGSKATGFRSMVVAQFTGVSLQKDDRAFVKYSENNREYENTFYAAGTTQTGSTLSSNSSSTSEVYHLDSAAVYRQGWEQSHIKLSNDAIIQVVSVFAIGYNKHFVAESGGDASITNSNSNFGQLSLVADGFKKDAFGKDNKAFITHIIPPRAIESTEEDIDWLTIDLGATGNSTSRLYLFGFNNEQIKPPVLTQGYRIGAKVGDKLFLGSDSAEIVMPNTTTSSFKESSVSSVGNDGVFTTSTNHGLETGEKVIIISDSGDLPENLRTNIVYYTIKVANNQLKLAASEAEATAGEEITVYGGVNLRIISRVSDKNAGDPGSPVQWDPNETTTGQWYINLNPTGNTIGALSGSGASEPTTIKRIADNRSLDEKVYKLRVVVPNKLPNSKTPENGFIIQETSATGLRTDADASLSGISTSDYDYNRNPRFISTCSFSSPTVTVVAELPHNLQTGDSVIVKNVTDSTNNDGLIDKGYNGTFDVTVTDDLTFTYTTATTPGAFTNNVNNRTTSLPRFERNDLKKNLYIYRNEIVSEYVDGDQSGVYHIYTLNANNNIQNQFTNLNYSQNVTNLYPQLDRDNNNDNPNSSKSYALRTPIGEVQTDDLKKSITRETIDKILPTFGFGLDVSSVTNPTSTSPTIVFDRNHGFAGIVTGSINAGSTGFTTGTYYNVKLSTESDPISNPTTFESNWEGATAKVTVSGSGGPISSVEIMNGGSNYSAGTYYLDTRVIGAGTNNDFTVVTSGISSVTGQVLQFTGVGTGTDTYHRITGVSGRDSVSIARTSGDPVITSDNYAFLTGPSVSFTGVGNTITATGHGLIVGNKFRSIGSNNINNGDYVVTTVTDVNTFTVTGGIGTASGFILKHGLSSNEGISDKTDENLQGRGITIFDGEILTVTESTGITTSATSFSVSGAQGGVIERFPLGTYIQVNDEIMRIKSDSLSSVDKISVIRGALATRATFHPENSIVKRIKIPAIEFRRPSILRASGHTFEYLGYGPGNYSTALPQVQDRTLTEREEFLSQSQERSAGLVVYTGMNNKGDFFIGNQKKSSATGEETTFDTPIPSVTGENPARLSVVFDEIIVKERIVVEGGDSGQVLSQFDGPVNFTKDVRIKNNLSVQSITSTGTVLPINDPVDVDGTVTADGFVATTPAFTNINGNDIYHMLRSNGTQGLITSGEVTNALGYVPANAASITGDFPLGNSIVLDNISSQFDGNQTIFSLRSNSNPFTPAGSSANLIVSIGGVIQKPGTDFNIVLSGSNNTDEIEFTTAPQTSAESFIVALGGQGSLISNIDWDNKGEILVAITNNSATKLAVGSNGTNLVADSSTTSGVTWRADPPLGAVFFVAAGTAAPTGYLKCDGTVIPTSGIFQGVSASRLQELRTLLGTTYGSDGQLPNLVNRFVGYSAVPGDEDGSADAVVVSHSHGITEPNNGQGHRHGYQDSTANLSGSRYGDEGERLLINNQNASRTTNFATTGILINSEGVSATNANLPPYLGMLPIIKY